MLLKLSSFVQGCSISFIEANRLVFLATDNPAETILVLSKTTLQEGRGKNYHSFNNVEQESEGIFSICLNHFCPGL